MYDNIISISKDDFMRLGYDKQEAWRQLAKDNAHKIADKIGVPPSRLEYIASMHIDKGKPNFHLLFWDKEQGVKEAYIHPKISNSIRVDLTKTIYHHEMEELHNIKNEARDTLISNSDNFFKDFFRSFGEMTKKEYEDAVTALETSPDMALGKLLDRDIPDILLDDFAERIIRLKDKLPTSGRLSYAFLPLELKNEVKAIIKDLVSNNTDFKIEFDKYIKTNEDLSRYFTTNTETINNAGKKAEDELLKRLSNRLLKNIKDIDFSQFKYEKEAIRTQQQKAYQRHMAIKIISDLFNFLTRNNEAMQAKLNTQKGEMSKEARTEIAIKNEHSSGMDWDG